MKSNVLYPQGYDEVEAAKTPKVPKVDAKAGDGKDLDAALTLIRRAVPADGEPLSYEQLVVLVCGGYGSKTPAGRRGSRVIRVDDAEAEAIEAAREHPKSGVTISGPDVCRSLRPSDVLELIEIVAQERRSGWKEKRPKSPLEV